MGNKTSFGDGKTTASELIIYNVIIGATFGFLTSKYLEKKDLKENLINAAIFAIGVPVISTIVWGTPQERADKINAERAAKNKQK